MSTPIFSAKFALNSIDLYDGYVVIKNPKTLFKGEQRIYLDRLISINFRKPSWLAAGYIQLVFPDSKVDKVDGTSVPNDEFSAIFRKKSAAQFEKLRDMIDEQRRKK